MWTGYGREAFQKKAGIDIWLKEIAPSEELRKWFGHHPARWEGFKKKYIQELKKNKEQVSILKKMLKNRPATLVHEAKDEEHNQAIVLKEFFSRRFRN